MTILDLRAEAQAHKPRLPYLPELQEMAIGTWRGRMINEHGSARVFEGLAKQLEQLGLDEADLSRVRSFAAEERKHGVLCGAVVEALGGQAMAPALEVVPFPKHDEVSLLEGALRNLISISCLSETIAVALIGAEREEMPEGELKTLLTTIYAEECGHANYGWRLLPKLLAMGDDTLLDRLSEYLLVAFAHLERHELAHLPADVKPPEEGKSLGLCSGLDARKLFYAAIEQIIVPGLSQHGLKAQWAWDNRSQVR